MSEQPDDHNPHSQAETDELREAFALFSDTSQKLAAAYTELQGQVARLSSELAAANGELARRERLSALGEMAAKLAHQLRTPLAAAMLYVGHLGKPQLADPDRQRFAGKAMDRLHYLERLVSDMLTFVKGGAGVVSRFHLHDLLVELQKIVEGRATMAGVGFEVEDQVGALELEADRQAVLAALTSLSENAIQASEAGGRVRLVAHAGEGAFVALRVEDEGRGIAEQDRERLFDPFYTTRSEGSGLGLAIVKQTADAHGGWVDVHSEMGRGSRFTLYLPTVHGAHP